MIKEYLEQSGLAIRSYEEACAIQKILIENGNAVMITREEDLWIINWVWCEGNYADRNKVIFIDRGVYEGDWFDFCDRHREIIWDEDE